MNRLKTLQEKKQVYATIKQETATPLPQHYAYAVWENEEGRMLEFKHLLNHKTQKHKRLGGHLEPMNIEY